MPKMKTKKALAARFKLTATGQLKRAKPGRRHKLTGKTAKRKRQLATSALVDEGHLRTYKRVMCV